MRIYLTQHGMAVPKDEDPDRPLSDDGRRNVQRLARFLRDRGVRVARLLHSGKTRAEQTAALLAGSILVSGQHGAHDGLGPKDPLEKIVPEIAFWSEDTLLVGHLPHLGRLAALLVASNPDLPIVAFKPGSVVCLERDGAVGWSLAWMIRPELLTAVGD